MLPWEAAMSTITPTVLVTTYTAEGSEVVAVAGFLAGYCGATRVSYTTDLRIFADWCHERKLTLFSVRRAHLELFGRWTEQTGWMRSTVARRLSTLASFYRYCEQEQLVGATRPSTSAALRLTTRRALWDWTATSSALCSCGPGSAPPAITP